MIKILIQGFLLQASLILALGAQNIFVLNSGLKRERHLLVALVSSICDTLLIFVGVLSVATFFVQYPLMKIGLGLIGVGFLFFYGILKIKDAKQGIQIDQSNVKQGSVKQTILLSMGFSLLNPHVYLDTVVLIGGYSSKFNELIERFYFGAGASLFSCIWFFGLAMLASLGYKLLNSSKAMNIISLLSGIILLTLALKLGGDVYSWITYVY